MKVNREQSFSSFAEQWSPKIAAELNGQLVKLVKFQGEFVWHKHDDEDEMFLVHRGSFVMEFRDQSVELNAGEFIVIPKGVEHRPVAEKEAEVILFEPATTLNTGNVINDRTLHELGQISPCQ
jgi:mannose-6-phosphate isomerase-like protein (cupin superfamily)